MGPGWLALALGAVAAEPEKIRGMTISTPTWGAEWGADETARTLDVLDGIGVNWVSYHPYARIRGDGTVQWRPIDPQAPPDWLVRPIREAHARGQKVMVTPHLAHWGSPFSWRGAITFADEASWERFFRTYGEWVAAVAAATREADAFVIGSELDATAHREAEWRALIRRIRGIFPGPLTYAANWDRYEQVPFWDAVDAAGIQAYFPLSLAPRPDPVALASGWAAVGARLEAFHARTGKHVVFTELGYDDVPNPAAEPWAEGRGGDPELQRACLEAALRAVESMPVVVGAFLWKWFPGEVGEGDFEMSRPDLRRTIAAWWGR